MENTNNAVGGNTNSGGTKKQIEVKDNTHLFKNKAEDLTGITVTGLGEKAREINEVNQDLDFGGQKTLKKQDKLSWENLDIRRLKYFKVTVADQTWYGFLLPGEELKGDLQKYGTFISIEEYLKYAVLGEKEWNRLKGHYRNYKRLQHIEELELIRNSPVDEKKLLGKNPLGFSGKL